MTQIELKKKIEELKELEGLIKEAEAEVEALKDEIKAEMDKEHKEEMSVDRYTVRWKAVFTNRFDTTTFKEAMPKVYEAYVKQTVSRRFTIVG